MNDWINPIQCSICGHGGRWCGESSDGAVLHCRRVESDHPTETGWLHFRRDANPDRETFGDARIIDTRHAREDIGTIAESYARAASPTMVDDFAGKIGVTPDSLLRLRIGWAFDKQSRKGSNVAMFDAGDVMRQCGNRIVSFPMVDGSMHVVGIRLRHDEGKFSVSGGREGLFIPADLPDDGTLLICEGPTDCAALLDLGFPVVGRSNCTGGVRLLVELVNRRRPAKVTIVADGDAPGRRGAQSLACVLRLYAPSVCIIEPPTGTKDARAWRQAGASRDDVQAAIDLAPAFTFRVTSTIEGAKPSIEAEVVHA